MYHKLIALKNWHVTVVPSFMPNVVFYFCHVCLYIHTYMLSTVFFYIKCSCS